MIVCFVDIGKIVEHHCLNFLFIISPDLLEVISGQIFQIYCYYLDVDLDLSPKTKYFNFVFPS